MQFSFLETVQRATNDLLKENKAGEVIQWAMQNYSLCKTLSLQNLIALNWVLNKLAEEYIYTSKSASDDKKNEHFSGIAKNYSNAAMEIKTLINAREIRQALMEITNKPGVKVGNNLDLTGKESFSVTPRYGLS